MLSGETVRQEMLGDLDTLIRLLQDSKPEDQSRLDQLAKVGAILGLGGAVLTDRPGRDHRMSVGDALKRAMTDGITEEGSGMFRFLGPRQPENTVGTIVVHNGWTFAFRYAATFFGSYVD